MEEFYRLNPKRIERYQPFLMARLKADKDDDSERGWINGSYVARAIGAAMSKRNKYPNEPIKFYEPETNDEGEPLTDADRFNAFAAAFNAANAGRFKTQPSDRNTDINTDNTESL